MCQKQDKRTQGRYQCNKGINSMKWRIEKVLRFFLDIEVLLKFVLHLFQKKIIMVRKLDIDFLCSKAKCFIKLENLISSVIHNKTCTDQKILTQFFYQIN